MKTNLRTQTRRMDQTGWSKLIGKDCKHRNLPQRMDQEN